MKHRLLVSILICVVLVIVLRPTLTAQDKAVRVIPMQTYVVYPGGSAEILKLPECVHVGDALFIPNRSIVAYSVIGIRIQIFALNEPNEFHRRLLYLDRD